MMDDMEFYERQDINDSEIDEEEDGFKAFQDEEDSIIDDEPED